MKIMRVVATAVALAVVGTTVGAQQIPELPLASKCSDVSILGFDYSQVVTLTGTTTRAVTRSGPRGAGCNMSMGVDTDQGGWDWVSVQLAPEGTQALVDRGIVHGTFPPGTRLQITGYITAIRPLGDRDMIIYILPTSITAL